MTHDQSERFQLRSQQAKRETLTQLDRESIRACLAANNGGLTVQKVMDAHARCVEKYRYGDSLEYVDDFIQDFRKALTAAAERGGK